MVSSRTASAPPQKKCKKKGLPHYLMRQPLFMCGCIRLMLFFFHLQVGPVAVASLQGVGDGVRIPLFQNL